MTLTEYGTSGPFTGTFSVPPNSTTSTKSNQKESIMHAESSGSILVEPREPDSPRPPGVTPARTPVARCADGHGTLSALFFSDNVIDIARAKAMCGLCPLQVECLTGALEREEPWGVWGGQLLSGGRIIANKRPCGRPPKHPRPEMVIDELGPVPFAVA